MEAAPSEATKGGVQDLAAAVRAVGGVHFRHKKRMLVLFSEIVKSLELRRRTAEPLLSPDFLVPYSSPLDRGDGLS
jgi:hypothetical protein